MEEKRYRAYLTDALMILTENTARFAGGRHLTKRWYKDNEREKAPRDDKSGDEIAADFIRRAGLTLQGR